MVSGGTTLTRVDWYGYVRQWAGDDSAQTIGSNIGISLTTVTRWQTRAPSARDVIQFARCYGRPVPEALMAAFGVTPEELGVDVVDDPGRLSNDQLLEELRRRLDRGKDDRSRKMVRDQQAVKRQRQSRDQSRNVSRNLRDS